MNIPQPIIILGSPRSGTSLVASIFAAHGVFVGTSREADSGNPKGYYENVMLAEMRYRMGHGDGLDPALVEDTLYADGYIGGPWLVKHSPPTWRSWRRFTPKWVLIHRAEDETLRSRINCAQWDMTEAEHRIAIQTDEATVPGIKKHIGGVDVWPAEFFTGRWDALADAFAFCGLDFDPEIAESRTYPDLWNEKEIA